MKSIRSLALAAIVSLTIGGVASAQFDPGLGTATLTINGKTPSVVDPTNHLVEAGTAWTLNIADPNNVGGGFILLASVTTQANWFDTSGLWGGSIDVPAPTIPLDGIGFSVSSFDTLAAMPFSMTLPVPGAANTIGAAPSVQAICLDGANAPFFLRNTQAGQAVRTKIQTLVAGGAIGDDAFATVPLTVSPALFNGTSYTQIFVCSNGMLSFTAGSTDFSATQAEFTNGFRATGATLAPGVACVWGDYARGTVTNDTITVNEAVDGSSTTVEYANQQHWDSQTAAGSWSVNFDNLGDVCDLDMTGYLPSSGADGLRIIGVTCGLTAATTTFGSIAGLGSGYTTAVGPESIGEGLGLGVAPSSPTMHFYHTGGVPNDFVWTVIVP